MSGEPLPRHTRKQEEESPGQASERTIVKAMLHTCVRMRRMRLDLAQASKGVQCAFTSSHLIPRTSAVVSARVAECSGAFAPGAFMA